MKPLIPTAKQTLNSLTPTQRNINLTLSDLLTLLSITWYIVSSFQKKKKVKARKMQSEETKQASKPGPTMAKILELSDWVIKTTVIEKLDDIQNHMNNANR